MSENAFDPSRYLTKVGSADYLEVKWRLVWLREVHPDATIETELISFTDKSAVFKAVISIPGGGTAHGHGTESLNDFREFFEKAETKAIGRALGALGFGTQFCEDFTFGAPSKLVDSPVDHQNGARAPQPQRQVVQQANGNGKPTIANPDAPVSDKQADYIRGLAKQIGMVEQGPDGQFHVNEGELAYVVKSEFDADWPGISKGKASEIIEDFQSRTKQQAMR